MCGCGCTAVPANIGLIALLAAVVVSKQNIYNNSILAKRHADVIIL